MVGETFQTVIASQFEKLRDGDRLWFENQGFDGCTLDEIKHTTLADIIERNTDTADAPAAALKVLAAKLQRPAECFESNRAFLRGVAQLGGFLARTSDGEPGWQTLWKGWSVLMTLVEGYELAQTITSDK